MLAVDEAGFRRPDRRLCWLAGLATPLLIAPGWWLAASRSAGAPSFIGAILVVLLVVVSGTDLAWHKIPNWATYPAILWALAIEAVVSMAGATGWTPGGLGRIG